MGVRYSHAGVLMQHETRYSPASFIIRGGEGLQRPFQPLLVPLMGLHGARVPANASANNCLQGQVIDMQQMFFPICACLCCFPALACCLTRGELAILGLHTQIMRGIYCKKP